MDSSEKYKIEKYIESRVYTYFAQCAKSNMTADPTFREDIAPFIQMYQAIQIKQLQDELSSIWRLLVDGHAGVWINGNVDVDLKEQPVKRGK